MSLWEVRFSGAHSVVKVYLTFTRWRHIIIMPKGESVSSVYSATTEKTNPLGEATPRGFYHFTGWTIPEALLPYSPSSHLQM